MKWFKHDADASIDSKLQSLLLDYGASGYGLYWYCIELIAQNVNEHNITFELDHDARIIARNLNLTFQETKDMMKYMIELGLFSLNNEKLVCYSLAKRLDQSMTSSPKMRNIISNIKENHDSVMIKSCKKRIDKKRIEENREDKNKKENLFSQLIKEFDHYDIYKNIATDFISYRKQIKKPLKTILPIKQFIDSLVELSKLGYQFDYCIEQMKLNEWQTVKIDYIHKRNKPQQKSKQQQNNDFIDEYFYNINKKDENIVEVDYE